MCCRSDVGDRARHGDESADDAAAAQRKEADSRRAEGRKVLRPSETQQQRGEEVARLPQGARGRDRYTRKLSREGERDPARAGGDAARGGELVTATATAETIAIVMGFIYCVCEEER